MPEVLEVFDRELCRYCTSEGHDVLPALQSPLLSHWHEQTFRTDNSAS